MNHPEINCDIISDLIPSYLEDICTDSTKKAVEEHTRMCENCRIRLEMLKNTKLTDKECPGRRSSLLSDPGGAVSGSPD